MLVTLDEDHDVTESSKDLQALLGGNITREYTITIFRVFFQNVKWSNFSWYYIQHCSDNGRT